MAGTMFQAKTGNTPGGSPPKGAEAPAASKTTASDGPWLASCNYWSAARTSDTPGEKAPSPPEVIIAQSHGVKLQLESAEEKATCGPDAWGMPERSAEVPEISAMIATVPDPIHSHLALDFDRSIDAILLAAEDNNYLGSYYWLPWRSQISISSAGESTSAATRPTDEDRARERQPGLIILRSSYRRVIYLFLVGETPALGVNGDQLQNAFQYEKLLRGWCNPTHSVRPSSPRLANAAANAQQSAAGKQQTLKTSPRSNTRGNKRAAPVTQNISAGGATKNQQAGVPKNSEGKPCPTEDKLKIIGPAYSGSASSLHAGIAATFPDELSAGNVSINGATSTEIAARALDPENKQIYRSFGENTAFEQDRFLRSLAAAGYDLSRVAVLSEAGTVFGSFGFSTTALVNKGTILYLRFPRELSLLRNAEPTQSSKPDSSAAPPTPYLNLSLKDRTADDTVPRFSTNQSPLSIEAQLMAIAHQLQRARSQFIVISASNVLDDIFLVQFLHRACPDARLVILSGGDLLFERDTENASYIGSISISPYLLSSLDFGNRVQWLHASFEAEAIYNAASFAFWNSASPEPPLLAGYRSYPVPDRSRNPGVPLLPEAQFEQIPLWATVIGADGYYPLAVLDWCASDSRAMLPTVSLVKGSLEQCDEKQPTARDKRAPEPQNVWKYVPESINQNSGISPSLLWGVLASFIVLACVLHTVFLWTAELWSPLTRDLAIDQNDLPHRRSVYLNIGTSVLVAMAFVTACPLILVGRFFHLADPGYVLAWMMIGAACLTGVFTFAKTWRYCCPPQCHQYTFFNVMAAVALGTTIVFWTLICSSGNGDSNPTYAGLYFSYRCLRPLSGVCPLLPILLLLLAWYLWSIYQTARLRFSEIHRPRLARLFNEQECKLSSQVSCPPPVAYLPCHTPYSLFVPDDALDSCSGVTDNCLYKNITCLLITREVLYRFCTRLKDNSRGITAKFAGLVQTHIDAFLLCIYLFLFGLCLFAIRIHSIERFLFAPFLVAGGPTPYEFLIMALFFPLIMVALSGWLRAILIWGAISRGLLEPLERMPIRFAFSQFKAGSWMSMLRQKGLHLRWRDMGRSTESIRQIVHHPELQKRPTLYFQLLHQYELINARIHGLIESMKPARAPASSSPAATTSPSTAGPGMSPELAAAIDRAKRTQDPCPSDLLWDLPKASADLCGIYRIEQGFAEFCRLLLDGLLVPHWEQERIGLVEETSVPKEESDKSTDRTSSEPSLIRAAEELIVVRYVALIRAVLINIRYLMLFVSAAFVLALVAWNSYPFQPHAFIDWCFTILLAILTVGFVWVLAQMHRNAILSRITDTTPNELGWEFYIRMITLGAIPILTWLAYQFPQIGGNLYKIIQPGLQVVK